MAAKKAAAKKAPAKPVATMKPADPKNLNAKAFIAALKANQSDAELKKILGYFRSGEGEYGHGDKFIGVRMGTVFALAQAHIGMPLGEIEKLMESDIHEARAGAMSIMARQASAKKATDEHRKALYDLYLRRHDRINNWDLVDLAARDVVGAWLADKDRKPLYRLAKSKNMWERRTALYACLHFIMRLNETKDTEAICASLVGEKEEIIQKAVGGLVRSIGIDRPRLLAFLDKHAAKMPRVMLRYSIEKLTPAQRAHYMAL
jgi:3-methyladenine DNA glycosylase AlkD